MLDVTQGMFNREHFGEVVFDPLETGLFLLYGFFLFMGAYLLATLLRRIIFEKKIQDVLDMT